ncbi:MAG TPA: MOSC domain-containing protein [Acidimicrobiales bacterium]|nr:MOSC domain-containing protein [Acidimicrobiales bacterium]
MVATVAEIWRYPVKSMQGERVGSSGVDERGLAFDRAYALMDAATGMLASAKRPRPWGALLQMSARVIENDPTAGSPPVVEVDFGGESTVIRGADDPKAAKAISAWVGREVRIVSVAPEGAAFEEVWVQDMGAPESMYAPVTADDEDGLPVLSVPGALGAPDGTLFDFASLHILASASIRSLSAALGDASVDVRRFRPNLLIETGDGTSDYPDNEWSRSALRIGGSLEARGIMATMRCVMVTLPQGELVRAREVLQTLNRVNRLDVPSMGSYPCIGVYARVVRAGTVSEGDEVVVLDG